MSIDPFAGGDSAPAISFKNQPIGTSYDLEVLEEARLVQSRDFETGELATWPDGNPKMAAVVRVRHNGEEKSLWASKPSSLFTALAEAQRAAATRIAPGGRLAVKFVREEPNRKNPRLNAQKIYEAKYTAGDAFADDDQPPF